MNSTVESSQKSDHETKLKKHVLKVHKCQPCGKSFTRLGSLMKHIHTIHESHKDNKCKFCGKSFSQEGDFKRHIHTSVTLVVNNSLHCKNWKYIFTQFMMAIKIKNVNLVVNHFLKQAIWRNTFTFMKATKITNANLVVNHLLGNNTWRSTFTQFMNSTKITNVILVANYFLTQQI